MEDQTDVINEYTVILLKQNEYFIVCYSSCMSKHKFTLLHCDKQ